MELWKSHQNSDFTYKQAMRKSYPPTGFEPAAFGLPVQILRELQFRILWEDNFFALLAFK